MVLCVATGTAAQGVLPSLHKISPFSKNLTQPPHRTITMANEIISVIIASSSSVAKVFVIGGIGYVSAKRPRPIPILPSHAMDAISKMNFNLVRAQKNGAVRCSIVNFG
mmetsp:Transcript_15538/g.29493  ORF Transcript_15538/g.29493 Transcript_15538/m.29493 type:complete len:109 (-) Transcript_15538:3110-3436(-)